MLTKTLCIEAAPNLGR